VGISKRETTQPQSRLIAGDTYSPPLAEQPEERWQLSLGRLPNHPGGCTASSSATHPPRCRRLGSPSSR